MADNNLSLTLGFDALLRISTEGTILQIVEGHRKLFLQNPLPLCVASGFTAYFKNAQDVLFTFNLFKSNREFQQSSLLYVNIGGAFGAENWISMRLTRTDANQDIWAYITDANEVMAKLNQAWHEASHDSLTGLKNRSALFSELTQLCLDPYPLERFALVSLDLDGFKQINDAFGHLTGDKFLQEIATRFKKHLNSAVSGYRLGGDEFAFIVRKSDVDSEVLPLANKVLMDCAMPSSFPGTQTLTSGSIGISLFPDNGQNAEMLVGAADIAMYQAKRQGKNRILFYKHEEFYAVKRHIELASQMQVGVSSGEFLLHYQPIFSPEGVLQGCEALMRWQRPDGTEIHPLEFIPVAEQTGLIKLLGNWALKTAALQMKNWTADVPNSELYVSVNVSPYQFSSPTFVSQVTTALQLSELPARQLQLEITESAMLADPDRAAKLLKALKEMGVRLAIDDFGTGYSSLAYLRNFPVDVIKIDRSFIQNLFTDKANRAIVKAVATLASELEMTVVAEGVETQDQLNYLKEKQINSIQGWIFGKAQPADSFENNYIRVTNE